MRHFLPRCKWDEEVSHLRDGVVLSPRGGSCCGVKERRGWKCFLLRRGWFSWKVRGNELMGVL